MTDTQRHARLETFVAWVNSHITGDEKGEAQIFLDRLFQAFNWPGLREAGASCELRLKKDSGGTAFADLVWKPTVLIEMKRRGVDLSRHYRQAFDYWTRLVPGRPRYAVLCNFDEFWIFDFETQMDTPVDKLKLVDLPGHYGPLAFLFPGDETPVFGNHQESVTREAANHLAGCFNSLLARGVDRALAQRFTLQTLMALFAEDIGLLQQYFFTRLLDECKTPTDTYDLLGGLFEAMNTPGGVKGGRFRDVAYFNGGLFAEPARVELDEAEMLSLRLAADANWSKVRPEIFGTLFEHSLEKEERHAFGAHFTSGVDIMKIVGPTIVDPWREAIEGASTLKDLRNLLSRIEGFTVLDPACGSGNFLYIAYRELKRLEARIYERMAEQYKSVDPAQRAFGFVTTQNFYGMDINPFAIDIAKVTMMLGHKLAIDELHTTENALPLDNLDGNFRTVDALITEVGARTPWPRTDVIIGNPPFLGAKRLKPERGVAYVNAVRKAYPEIPGMADYCVYWFRRANSELAECTSENSVGGRAGLVGTQNIRNNASRVGGLDVIVAEGTIVEAVDNQPWSGEANVNVSIVNWTKTQDSALIPEERKLWSAIEIKPAKHEKTEKKGKAEKKSAKAYDLVVRSVDNISPSLSDQTNVSTAEPLPCNTWPQRVFVGVMTGHVGFVLSPSEMSSLTSKDPNSAEVIRPYLIGREVVSGDGLPQRFVIDFCERTILEAMRYEGAFHRIQRLVLPDIEKKASEEHEDESARKQQLEKWWIHWRHRSDMKRQIEKLNGRYLTSSRTQRWPFVFSFMDKSVLPGDKMQVFAFDDDYSFGIIQSEAHGVWYRAKAARLKNEVDYNYSAESVFDTFPWPQSVTAAQIDAVAAASREIQKIRTEALANKIKGGIRALYHSLAMPGTNPLKTAHAALDSAVFAAYGFSSKRPVLDQLLALNTTVMTHLREFKPVSGPGIPLTYEHPERLVKPDCLGSL